LVGAGGAGGAGATAGAETIGAACCVMVGCGVDQHEVQEQDNCDTAEAAYRVLLLAPKLTRAPWPLHMGHCCRKLPFNFRAHL
jgi:hypothetical protein